MNASWLMLILFVIVSMLLIHHADGYRIHESFHKIRHRRDTRVKYCGPVLARVLSATAMKCKKEEGRRKRDIASWFEGARTRVKRSEDAVTVCCKTTGCNEADLRAYAC